MIDDALGRVEARLTDNSEALHRLNREQRLLVEAASRLRTGATAGPILAQLWEDGVDLGARPARAVEQEP